MVVWMYVERSWCVWMVDAEWAPWTQPSGGGAIMLCASWWDCQGPSKVSLEMVSGALDTLTLCSQCLQSHR